MVTLRQATAASFPLGNSQPRNLPVLLTAVIEKASLHKTKRIFYDRSSIHLSLFHMRLPNNSNHRSSHLSIYLLTR